MKLQSHSPAGPFQIPLGLHEGSTESHLSPRPKIPEREGNHAAAPYALRAWPPHARWRDHHQQLWVPSVPPLRHLRAPAQSFAVSKTTPRTSSWSQRRTATVSASAATADPAGAQVHQGERWEVVLTTPSLRQALGLNS